MMISKRICLISLIVLFLFQFSYLGWLAHNKISIYTDKDAQTILLDVDYLNSLGSYDARHVLSGHSLVVTPSVERNGVFKFDETITTGMMSGIPIYATVVPDANGIAQADRFSRKHPVQGAAAGAVTLKGRLAYRWSAAKKSQPYPNFNVGQMHFSEDEIRVIQEQISRSKNYVNSLDKLCNLNRDLATSEVVHIVKEHYSDMTTTETISRNLMMDDKGKQVFALCSFYDSQNRQPKSVQEQRMFAADIVQSVKTVGMATNDDKTSSLLRLRVSRDGNFSSDGIVIGGKTWQSQYSKEFSRQ